MSKIVILSHCILNGCCELPEASDALRSKIMTILLSKKANIIQLPCPELCFQALDRKSVYPGDSKEVEYKNYCERLILNTIKNVLEYDKYGIEIMGIIGIDTSPSCSIKNSNAILMKTLVNNIRNNNVCVQNEIDMPIGIEEENGKFLEQLEKW